MTIKLAKEFLANENIEVKIVNVNSEYLDFNYQGLYYIRVWVDKRAYRIHHIGRYDDFSNHLVKHNYLEASRLLTEFDAIYK